MSQFSHSKRAKEKKRKERREAKAMRKRERRELEQSGEGIEQVTEGRDLLEVMAGAGPLTPAELASRALVAEPHARGWLVAQVAAGTVIHDAKSDRYLLSREGTPPDREGAGTTVAPPVKGSKTLG